MSMHFPPVTEVTDPAPPAPAPKPLWLWPMITIICLGGAVVFGIESVQRYGTTLGAVATMLALAFLALGAAWTIAVYEESLRPSPRRCAWMRLGWSLAFIPAAAVAGVAMWQLPTDGSAVSHVAATVAIVIAGGSGPAAVMTARRACRVLVSKSAA